MQIDANMENNLEANINENKSDFCVEIKFEPDVDEILDIQYNEETSGETKSNDSYCIKDAEIKPEQPLDPLDVCSPQIDENLLVQPTERFDNYHEGMQEDGSIPFSRSKKCKTRYSCQICNQAFRYISGLKVHMLIHTGEKPYSCDVCNKSFIRKEHLNTHRTIHTGQKSFICDICDSAFNRKSVLNKHMLIHSGNLDYVCNVCGKPFRCKPNLDRHMLTHTGVKNFVCEMCERSFAQKSHLEAHMPIHTGELPYPCKMCDKKFKNSSGLSRHKKMHVAKQTFVKLEVSTTECSEACDN